MAAGDGLDMRFDLTRGANTFDGHRLLQLAAEHGLQTRDEGAPACAPTTPRASWSPTTTRSCGSRARSACRSDEAREMLASDRFAAEVREDEQTARGLGINAVPTFVVDRRVAVSGAQPPAVLRELLQRGAPVS